MTDRTPDLIQLARCNKLIDLCEQQDWEIQDALIAMGQAAASLLSLLACEYADRREDSGDPQDEAREWLDERAEVRVKMRRLDAATSGQNGRSRRASARSVSSTTASAMAELLE
jgi:hypothetical protein